MQLPWVSAIWSRGHKTGRILKSQLTAGQTRCKLGKILWWMREDKKPSGKDPAFSQGRHCALSLERITGPFQPPCWLISVFFLQILPEKGLLFTPLQADTVPLFRSLITGHIARSVGSGTACLPSPPPLCSPRQRILCPLAEFFCLTFQEFFPH